MEDHPSPPSSPYLSILVPHLYLPDVYETLVQNTETKKKLNRLIVVSYPIVLLFSAQLFRPHLQSRESSTLKTIVVNLTLYRHCYWLW
jgi:hypothetical protein